MPFPSTIDTFATLVDNVDTVFAFIPNERGTAITSIETALGINMANLTITGEIRLWGSTIATIPSGWLHCNGATVLRATYPALYNIIGSQYGTATSTTFILPDTRDVFAIGASSDSDGVAVSNISGASLKTGGSVGTSTASSNSSSQSGGNPTTGAHGHNFYPPYVALVFMIKT